MKRALQIRALHFLVLGGALFAGKSWWSGVARGSGPRPEIVVTAAQREEIRRDGQPLGRRSTPEEEGARLDRVVDDEILYREALARGLDRDNPVVRERVIQSMRLLSDDPQADEATLFRQGLRLGLDRSDVVVRRHLAATMRVLAAAAARRDPPSDAELREVLAREADLFRLPRTTSVTHVFVSSARGALADGTARAILAALRSGRVDPAEAPRLGDAFPPGFRLSQRTDADLDAVFGPRFAAGVAELPLESWGGPIASSYGLHLVWVHARIPERMPSLDSVRGRLVEHVYHLRAEQRLRDWLAVRRTRYEIRIEEPRDRAARPVAIPMEALSLPRPAAVVGD